jgi:pyrimidine oxygenase
MLENRFEFQRCLKLIIGSDDFAGTAAHTERLLGHAAETGRDVGPYAPYFIITGETDDEAQAKWDYYREGADLEAIAFMTGQADLDVSGSTAAKITEMQNAFALNIGKIVGSHASVARQLDELAAINGLKGVMCIFDDFIAGTEDFGQKAMPLLHSR